MDDAATLVDYFSRLGVSHLYLSPILEAAPGSTHGYDGADPEIIDHERGGAAGLEALAGACAAAGLGLVIDVVPNHLSVAAPGNRWWSSVLRLGRASPFAGVFDIDWSAARADGGIVLPILDCSIDEAIVNGSVRLARRNGQLEIHAGGRELPASLDSAAELLRAAAASHSSTAGADLVRLADGLRAIAGHVEVGGAEARRLAALDRELGEIIGRDAAVAAAVDHELVRCTSDPMRLGAMLEAQHYRVMDWRGAACINYRRFFNITDLVGLRMEDPAVFELTHRLVLSLVSTGVVDGLRIDHPDGLRDPTGYFRRLHDATDGTWIVAEKILAAEEEMPAEWPVAGTTGYDFLNEVLGLFVDPSAREGLEAWHASFTGEAASLDDEAFEAKRLAATKLLAAELARLVRLLRRLAPHDARLEADDERLAEAVASLGAGMPVYRTYVTRGAAPNATDRRTIETAHREACRRRPELAGAIDALRDVLLGEGPVAGPAGELCETFTARFQQYTAAVMAKGVEDTLFYRHLAFIALNEVGGDPDRFGMTPERFHERMAQRAARWPRSMLATSTHDTKRSEDVRARLAVISECSPRWIEATAHWSNLAAAQHGGAVDRSMEYLFFQSAVGAWPIDADRLVAFMIKSAREAKRRSSWAESDTAYEAALESFVRGMLENDDFRAALGSFVNSIVLPGRVNSLSQLLLRLTAPGVPDQYQGTELWDLSLVDPDNRRPVDFERRRTLLEEARWMTPEAACARMDEGVPKLWLLHHALAFRRRGRRHFDAPASYEPLVAEGQHAHRLVAFCRGSGAVVVVPRLVAALGKWWGENAGTEHDAGGKGWGDTRVHLPEGAWRNVLTGEPCDAAVYAGQLLGRFPVALLERIDERSVEEGR